MKKRIMVKRFLRHSLILVFLQQPYKIIESSY